MNKIQIKFLAPLMNFKIDKTEVEFSKNLKIRKIESKEKSLFNDLTKQWQNIKYGDFLIECMLEKHKPEEEINQFLNDGRKEIEKILTYLRLFKEELIGYNFIIQPYEKDNYGYVATHFRHYELWFNPPSDIKLLKYILDENRINALINFSKIINDASYKRHSLAISYFNKSYIEPYTPRDSLLDLVIALDSLFIKEDQSELVYRLKMRIAHLLENKFSERNEISKIVQEAYKYRSQIVHGKKSPNISYEFLFQIRDIVRKAIKIFLLNPNLSNKLDNKILGENIKIDC